MMQEEPSSLFRRKDQGQELRELRDTTSSGLLR
jgi:hypothetical protein